MKNKIVIFIVILTLLTGAIGFWYYQKGSYSKDVLKLEALGPEETELLKEVEYTVKYKNNGNARLEKAKLIFEYPEHSIVGDGKALRQEIYLEDIYPGQERTLSFKGRLFGNENETKTLKAWLSYQPKNLKARYESATTFNTAIKRSPVNFEFDLLSKVEAGKELNFRLNYFSNIDYPISDLGILVEYPSGFDFIKSVPKTLEKTEWEIGLLNKAEGGRIEIAGKLTGEVGEGKVFRAKLGSWQDGEFVVLKEITKGVEIIQPALYIFQQINNNPEYTASPGDLLHYEIFFRNIGDGALTNLFLVVRLEGEAFDFDTIKSSQGDFGSGDNSIVFDWRRVSKLQFLDAQEEGKIEFWVELKKDLSSLGQQGKELVVADKIYLSQARAEFVTKINSGLGIVQKGYFGDEVFGNTGPIPPKVGETTTYTIIWQAKNYYNNVRNVQVKATLGENVRLTGKIFPDEAALTFDLLSKEVIWKVGDLEAGQGVTATGPSVAFQVALTPGVSQEGTVPEIINKVEITGEDQWTGDNLRAPGSAINTTLPDDSTVNESQGVVQ